MNIGRCVGVASLCLWSASAVAQLRVATWNISFYAGGREAAIRTAVYGEFSGRRMAPDVILLQEMENSSAASVIAGALNTAPGSPGDWVAAPYLSGADSVGGCVYRAGRVQFLGGRVIAVGSSSTANQPRNTERFDIRPVGYTGAGASIGMYCVHMKAGETDNDLSRRLVEADRIRSNAEGVNTNGPESGLPSGWNFLVGGDFNIQSSSQAAYVELTGSQANNDGRFFDPINTPGSWNNNCTYRFVHTQDPIGAGGMDDRHDQILISGSLRDGSGFEYVGSSTLAYSTSTWNDLNHSYRAWGNDGTSCNGTLTTVGNTMVGQAVAEALITAANGAGHLPVFLDLRLPPEITTVSTINFGTVMQGSAATQGLAVTNSGDVAQWGVNGVAALSYTLTPSAGFTAPAGTFTEAASGGSNLHTITMNTATLGVKSGMLTIASNSPDEPARMVMLTGTVVGNNLPPVADAGPDQTVTDLNNSSFETVTLDGSGSSDSDGVITRYVWRLGTLLLSDSAQPTVNLALPAGENVVTLTVTDDDLATSVDTVTIIVNRPPVARAGIDQTLTDADRSGDELVTLDGSQSTDADGSLVLYKWMEGSTVLASTSEPVVSLPLAVGGHAITLTVTDDDGGTATDAVQIQILPPACAADFNGDESVDGDDVIAFFTAWDGGNADFNGDDSTDGDDVISFFERWDAGC